MKKRRLLAILIAAAVLLSCMPATVSAATAYKRISDKPVKVGKYYYKYNQNSNVVRSKKKNSGYKVIINKSMTYDCYTNGKYIYGIYSPGNSDQSSFSLVRYTAAGKSRKVLKKLPFSSDDSLGGWNISTFYGNNIFLTKADGENFWLYTYSYNIKNKKLTLLRSKCGIEQRSGKYVLAGNWLYTGMPTPDERTLYEITSKGKLKKIRQLGEHSGAAFIGKKLYYTVYTVDGDIDSIYDYGATINVRIYSSNLNGKKAKLLGSFSHYARPDLDDESDGYCDEWSDSFSSKYCEIFLYDAAYRFYYASKKLVEI